MKRELLTAALLSLATLYASPGCQSNDRPTDRPNTRPAMGLAARRTADGGRTNGQRFQDVLRKQDQTKRAMRDRAMSTAQADAGEGEVP